MQGMLTFVCASADTTISCCSSQSHASTWQPLWAPLALSLPGHWGVRWESPNTATLHAFLTLYRTRQNPG